MLWGVPRFSADVLAPMFLRRCFGADVLAPTFLRQDVLAPKRFGADTF